MARNRVAFGPPVVLTGGRAAMEGGGPRRAWRGCRTFKNPPQPHMCIQDTIRGTDDKLYINVLSWKQIGNAHHTADLIPLYGGMQIPHGCTPNCSRPPLTVFAVMVNPEILKLNGKYAPDPLERDALVSLICDFVEAMNPGLHLTRQPIVLKDRDLAGELKDIWHAVQQQREREKVRSQEAVDEVTHKVYHIDGPPSEGAGKTIDDVIYNTNKDVSLQPKPNSNRSAVENTFLINNRDFVQNHIRKCDSASAPADSSLNDATRTPSTAVTTDQTHTKPISSSSNAKNVQNVQSQDANKRSESHIIAPMRDSNRITRTGLNSNIMTLNDDDDNKDIPFVDDYHDGADNTRIICNSSDSVVDNMLQNLSLNGSQMQIVKDAPMTNFNDQRKVSLSSQKA